ncbi:hypothetical protein ACWDUN_24400 [Mycobacterium sp. NPDC003323]
MNGTNRITALGLGSMAAVAAFMSLGSGLASADVTEVAPSPQVTSRQAILVDDNALRSADYGEARGAGETRLADAGEIVAQGEVRDTTKAIPGSKAAPFNLEANGSFVFDPPISDW